MHVRATFAAFALASLVVLPTVASSAIVQKWQTPTGTSYVVVSLLNDFDANGTFEMLTLEPASGGTSRIGVRSTTTGALLAQSAGTYQPGTFWFTYLEPTNEIEEIIFSDALTGNLVCVNYASAAVSVRWSFMPTATGVPPTWMFADFDGNGQIDMVFKDTGVNANKYYIRDNTGALVSTIDHTAIAPSGWTPRLTLDDYAMNGRQELMIDYHAQPPTTPTFQDILYVFGSNAPAPTDIVAPASVSSPAQQAHRAVRQFEPTNGVWAEVGHPEPEVSTALRVVRLP